MKFDPASNIQDLKQFGEFGGVNPSITDSSTFTFLRTDTMEELFDHELEGCFLYSRHWNPTNRYLAEALAAMEGTESAWITSSGMSAITSVIFQLCNSGDHIIASRTNYGGTFAFLKNYLPKFNIKVSFVDITDPESIISLIRKETRLIYCESIDNPLLEIANIPLLAKIADEKNIKLIVDNTFAPMVLSPAQLGAHIVVYSLTKFINGKNDCVAGAICASKNFISDLSDINQGTVMLLGPVLDSLRAANILKNLHTLHIRMKQHSKNALFVARKLEELGLTVYYPGLPSHPQYDLMNQIMNKEYGYGGMIAVDIEPPEKAKMFMENLQKNNVGYLAVSLGYFKTLFSHPGKSTSSEIPREFQHEIGLKEGLIRISVGLDSDIERTVKRINISLKDIDIKTNEIPDSDKT
jgi:methionine-gamma-lyase